MIWWTPSLVCKLKRRGMAEIEDELRYDPVHIVKRNRPAAAVISELEYQRLTQGKRCYVCRPERLAVAA